ncbi:MAG: glycosyltransferase [Bacteroidia bacterium]|nr:glycosyltransferase [Bacteroidia bacterium]
MVKEKLTPNYIFEASWEVCHKVGGIYTVLSTRANTLQEKFHDRVFFIGPDLWADEKNPLFVESTDLFAAWKAHAQLSENLSIRIGRWAIPGNPIVFLVDFQSFYAQKNEIYAQMWDAYQVDSLHAYGDYDEASMFAYACGKVVESFYRYHLDEMDRVVFQAHEWMTGMAALYLKGAVPAIGTIFTTHATSIGRSIAGNQKPLYDYLFAYNGDQMAAELNMQSKHSIEKQTAHLVDCFTTVSEITDKECQELLDKPADVVLVNGFEDDFVPKGSSFSRKRSQARKALLNVANRLLGTTLSEDALIVATSGRYEFKNKGIDVFLEALGRLNADRTLDREVLAFVNVPGWVAAPRSDLQERLKSREAFDVPLECPFITHWLHNMEQDQVLIMLQRLGIQNRPEDRVKVIFVPCYLNGADGIFNKEYYDLLLGQDLSVYPSYYEPWGYTPLESLAFRVPTITTDLAGFGRWANRLQANSVFKDGVEVIHRTDSNYMEVTEAIAETIALFAKQTEKEIRAIRKKAAAVAEQALWKHFMGYYYEAYDIALRRAMEREEIE